MLLAVVESELSICLVFLTDCTNLYALDCFYLRCCSLLNCEAFEPKCVLLWWDGLPPSHYFDEVT
jgi:hypothetical protein